MLSFSCCELFYTWTFYLSSISIPLPSPVDSIFKIYFNISVSLSSVLGPTNNGNLNYYNCSFIFSQLPLLSPIIHHLSSSQRDLLKYKPDYITSNELNFIWFLTAFSVKPIIFNMLWKAMRALPLTTPPAWSVEFPIPASLHWPLTLALLFFKHSGALFQFKDFTYCILLLAFLSSLHQAIAYLFMGLILSCIFSGKLFLIS